MTTATEIQAVATVESLLNPIDQFFVLDRQQKALAAQVKTLKDTIANTYDVCAKDAAGKIIPHRGEKYGVKVTIENRVGSVNVEAVIAALGITEAEFNAKFRGETSAIIKVTATA